MSKDLAPTIEVLSLGRKNRSREANDLLPYIPKFKTYFSSLPKEVAEMELRTLRVPLSDVDCITRTTVKVGFYELYQYVNADAYLKVELEKLIMHATDIESELTKVCASWRSSSWEELDWSRIKLLSIRDMLEAREQELRRAQTAQCLACPQFMKHVCPRQTRRLQPLLTAPVFYAS